MSLRSAFLFCSAAMVWACSSSSSSSSPQAPENDAGVNDAGALDGADSGVDAASVACNGSASLCAKKFDEVAYPCTHNAYSAAEYGFTAPYVNQTNGVGKQLEAGVRCMMLDIYQDGAARSLCHVSCALFSKPHLEVLAELKAFMDAHPREVITLDYEDYVPATDILSDLTTAGLGDAVFAGDVSAGWPTLGAMIDAGTRLVVGVEAKTTQSNFPPKIRDFYAIAWDTPYTFATPADFSCALNRGKTTNPLFLVNHWLSNSNGLPDKSKAATANAYDVLYTRAKSCADGANDFPNFIAVDFADVGDLLKAVATLNGVP